MNAPHDPAPLVDVDGHPHPAAAIIDALTPHVKAERRARMEDVLAHRLGSLALGIEDLHHSHNGSACLRTAEALGVQDVVAAELRHPYPLGEAAADPQGDALRDDQRPINRKITMAAHRWIDLHRVDDSPALLDFARGRGMAVYGAGPRGALTLGELPADRPVLLLFGNEREGLREETLAACDDVFRIPMYGFCESFNVSVSVGITLATHAARVRTRLAAEGRTGDLPDARRAHLLATWLLADVRGAHRIVRRKLG